MTPNQAPPGYPQQPQYPHGYPPPGYPPPGYAPPGYAPQPQVHAGARSARTYGLASLLCGFLAPVALFKGLAASKEIKRNPAAYTNASDATIGSVLGGIVTALVVIAVATGGGSGSGKGGGAAGGTSPFSGGGGAGAPASLPFVSQALSNCTKYKAGKNQIQKSAIFTANEQLLEGVVLTDVKGVLKRIHTNQGGNDLTLQIDVGDVELKTEGLFAPIKKGSAIYDTAAQMSEGECVVFSASGLRASSLSEQAKVCDTEYFAKFTALEACK